MKPIPEPNREAANLASRRGVMLGLAALALSGCSRSFDAGGLLDNFTTGSVPPRADAIRGEFKDPKLIYASMQDGAFAIPTVPYLKVPKDFRRRLILDPTGEAPGTIVVVLAERHLYLVQPQGRAIRYGVGIGKDGFVWSGRANIQYKREWPTWTPPAEMIKRKPELVKFQNGQEGGLTNPLGARALYIYQNDEDTGYRVHGTPEWWTIGQAMSSGCVRMINQDVIDLYGRVSEKTPIVVM